VLLLRYAPLDRHVASPVGLYLKRYMTRPMEATRVAGDLVMVAGAWLHLPWVIALGLAVIVAAWASGLLREFFA